MHPRANATSRPQSLRLLDKRGGDVRTSFVITQQGSSKFRSGVSWWVGGVERGPLLSRVYTDMHRLERVVFSPLNRIALSVKEALYEAVRRH